MDGLRRCDDYYAVNVGPFELGVHERYDEDFMNNDMDLLFCKLKKII